MALDLRVELFSSDLTALVDFYVRVLGFELVDDRRRSAVPYVALRRDGVEIGAGLAWEPVDPSARAVPTGVEIVLETDDLVGERDRVVAARWPLAEDLTTRPWGLTDFRVYDPDGYYLRITDRRTP